MTVTRSRRHLRLPVPALLRLRMAKDIHARPIARPMGALTEADAPSGARALDAKFPRNRLTWGRATATTLPACRGGST